MIAHCNRVLAALTATTILASAGTASALTLPSQLPVGQPITFDKEFDVLNFDLKQQVPAFTSAIGVVNSGASNFGVGGIDANASALVGAGASIHGNAYAPGYASLHAQAKADVYAKVFGTQVSSDPLFRAELKYVKPGISLCFQPPCKAPRKPYYQEILQTRSVEPGSAIKDWVNKTQEDKLAFDDTVPIYGTTASFPSPQVSFAGFTFGVTAYLLANFEGKVYAFMDLFRGKATIDLNTWAMLEIALDAPASSPVQALAEVWVMGGKSGSGHDGQAEVSSELEGVDIDGQKRVYARAHASLDEQDAGKYLVFATTPLGDLVNKSAEGVGPNLETSLFQEHLDF